MPANVCGSGYAYLLVTESGLTPDNPWELWPGPEDYDEWTDVVSNVESEVLRRWHYLLGIEDKLSKLTSPPVPGPFPERDLLLEIIHDFSNSAEQIHGPLRESLESLLNLELTWEPSIRRAIDAGRKGTCVLEYLDRAINYYGSPPLPNSTPPREPGTGDEDHDKGSELGGTLVTLAIVAGSAYYVWKRKKR